MEMPSVDYALTFSPQLDNSPSITYFTNISEGGEMITDIAQLYQNTVLAGREGAKTLLTSLLDIAAKHKGTSSTPWLWNMSGVEVVSASFARDAFLAMQALLLAQGSHLQPVFANAAADVREDLDIALKNAGKAVVACNVDSSGAVTDAVVIGALDGYARSTFALVREKRETDAKELMTEQSEERQIGHSAWNNRLSNLAALGLLVEIPQGRAKRYRAVV